MVCITLLVWFMAAFQQAAAPVQEQRGATIEGVVLAAGTGKPLSRAQVSLMRAGPNTGVPPEPTAVPPRRIRPITTDAQGRFVFTNVEPGDYRMTVVRNGYARQEYGQRAARAQGTVIQLVQGQVMKEVVFRLTPAAVITGDVRENTGEPVVGAEVRLLRSAYNAMGQRTLQPAGTARTDDRGEFRLYWVTAGPYMLSVSPTGRPGFIGPGNSNEVPAPRFATTYYPGTVDVAHATTLDVQAGREHNGIHFVLPQQQLYRVKGSVVDGTTGKPPNSVFVNLLSRQTKGESIGPGMPMAAQADYDAATGTFELLDVAPGSYVLRAMSGGSPTIPEGMAGRPVGEVMGAAFAARASAQTEVDVAGANVEGIALTLGLGASISGVLRVENQPLSALPNLDRIRVTLRPAAGGGSLGPQGPQRLSAEGGFVVNNVGPGEYRPAVMALPQDFYLKAVRLDGQDVLDQPLLVRGPVSGSLDVVVSATGGRIDGTVVDQRSAPVPGLQVVVIPEHLRDRPDLYKTGIAGASGEFSIKGIPPGEYTVFAWEAIEPFSYFDPEVLRQYERRGTKIRVTESSSQTIQVIMIPARGIS